MELWPLVMFIVVSADGIIQLLAAQFLPPREVTSWERFGNGIFNIGLAVWGAITLF